MKPLSDVTLIASREYIIYDTIYNGKPQLPPLLLAKESQHPSPVALVQDDLVFF